MSWLTPDLIDILLSIQKAVVILLVGCHLRRVHELRRERRLLGLFQNRYGPKPRRLGRFRCSWSPT